MRKDVRLAVLLAEAVGPDSDAMARAAAAWGCLASRVPDAKDFTRALAAFLAGEHP